MPAITPSQSGYAPVNGIKMYYELYGDGKPLVLIHGGGSTIGTSFGNILPLLATGRQIIAVEMQAHGHTSDRDAPETFEQDADDIAALLQHLKIESTDILGFSNGGTTAMQVAIRHPGVVNKLVLASAMYKREGLYPYFWEFMPKAELANMPAQLQEAYLAINNNPEGLKTMHNKDRDRMLNFKDWADDDIRSITAPTLVLAGDQDVVTPEHQLAIYRLLPNARLAILPAMHGSFLGEITMPDKSDKLTSATADLIDRFLNE